MMRSCLTTEILGRRLSENGGKFNEKETGKVPAGVFSIMNCRMGYAAVEREAKVENALKEGWEVVVSPRSLL
jgi:hypothetical protein